MDRVPRLGDDKCLIATGSPLSSNIKHGSGGGYHGGLDCGLFFQDNNWDIFSNDGYGFRALVMMVEVEF